jgi:hypothetical protein
MMFEVNKQSCSDMKVAKQAVLENSPFEINLCKIRSRTVSSSSQGKQQLLAFGWKAG